MITVSHLFNPCVLHFTTLNASLQVLNIWWSIDSYLDNKSEWFQTQRSSCCSDQTLESAERFLSTQTTFRSWTVKFLVNSSGFTVWDNFIESLITSLLCVAQTIFHTVNISHFYRKYFIFNHSYMKSDGSLEFVFLLVLISNWLEVFRESFWFSFLFLGATFSQVVY